MCELFFFQLSELNLSVDERTLLKLYYDSVKSDDFCYINVSGYHDGNVVNRRVPQLKRLDKILDSIAFQKSIYFLVQRPFCVVPPHKDDTRSCVINIPVSNINNHPTKWYQQEPADHNNAKPDLFTYYNNDTYIINTKAWHSVHNDSEFDRVMLQVELSTTYLEALMKYKEGTFFK